MDCHKCDGLYRVGWLERDQIDERLRIEVQPYGDLYLHTDLHRQRRIGVSVGHCDSKPGTHTDGFAHCDASLGRQRRFLHA